LLGRVPLAIVLAGSAIEDTNTPLERVREILSGLVTQSNDDVAAGLERANALVRELNTTPAVEQAEQKAKIFLSYSRMDRELVTFLADRLSELGHDVFFDIRSLKPGERWDEQLDQALKASDVCIVLLSEASAQSETIQSEIQRAYEYQTRNGKPRIIPVRVGDVQKLPASLAAIQALSWNSAEDNERLLQELVQALQQARSGLAEELYLRSTPEEQVIMQRIFLQLVVPGEGPEGNSNPVLRAILYQPAEDRDRSVLDKLIDARLLRTYQRGGAMWLEVANEALIRSWPRLVEWLEEEGVPDAPEGGVAGIDRSEARQAAERLERLKQEFLVEIDLDWGGSAAAWQPGTWTLADLDKLYRTLALMADLMGGREAFMRNLGGVSVRKSDIGSHGGEALAHRVSFARRAPLSAWAIVHEFAHAWDANSGWAFSRELERFTGGSTNRLRSVSARLLGNWDAGSNGPKNKPGRYGRLPGCNQAGYFYGDKPSGSNWHFNRVEDFAESVGMYLGWERDNELSEHAHKRIDRYLLKNGGRDAFGVVDNWADYAKYFYPENGDYTKTKRWQFIDDLFRRNNESPDIPAA
jgi:hypothetical protein